MLIKRLTHVEDNVFGTIEEMTAAIDTMTKLIEPRGHRDCRIEIKTDGSPAFVAGIDDGKFFVGRKGALTDPAKRLFSRHLIQQAGFDKASTDTMIALHNTLSKHAAWFKENKVWLQGDVLFSNGTPEAAARYKLSITDTDISCTPNVVEYRFPRDTSDGYAPYVGFVIHSAYSLSHSIPEYDPSFVPEYRFTGRGVYHMNNLWPRTLNPLAQMPGHELDLLLQQLDYARTLLFTKNHPIPVVAVEACIRTYNKFVKANRGGIVGAEEWYKTMLADVSDRGMAHVNTLKRESSKQSAFVRLQTSVESICAIKQVFIDRMTAHRVIRRVKDTVLSCIPHAAGNKMMEAYMNGEPTLGEGLVVTLLSAQNRIPVKLVDRSVFSYNNFALHGETTDGE